MIVYIYNIGVDLYNGFNGLRHRINWTYFTVLDGLAHPLYSRRQCFYFFFYCEEFLDLIHCNNRKRIFCIFEIIWKTVSELSSCMCPAVCIDTAFNIVISGICIWYNSSVKTVEEYLWIISSSVWCVYKQSDWIWTFFDAWIYPHIGFRCCLFTRFI